jgi:hypothetical protein
MTLVDPPAFCLPTFEEIADLPPSRLLAPFESLGNNCELGVLQGFCRCNAPPGLFRFAAYDCLDTMVEALDTNLEGLFDEGSYRFTAPPGWTNWRLDCDSHGFIFHSDIPISVERNTDEWRRKSGECLRVYRFLKREVLEELRAGQKVFVCRFQSDVTADDIQRLHGAVRRHGPGWLLFVTQDRTKPFAWTEKRADGLIVAAIAHLVERFGIDDIDGTAWVAIARAALGIIASGRERLAPA